MCTKCGECCRHIGRIPELAGFDRGDGVCIHLNENLCQIYDTRPDVCRVDTMYKIKYSKVYSKEMFYMLNLKACQELQESQRKKHLYDAAL